MDYPSNPLTLFPPAIHELLDRQCKSLGIPHDGACTLLGDANLVSWANTVQRIGGTWRLLPGTTEWSYSNWHVNSDRFGWLAEEFGEYVLSESHGVTFISHVSGLLEIGLAGTRFLVAGFRLPSNIPQAPEPRNVCILSGQSSAAQRDFLRTVFESSREEGTVTFWEGARGQVRVPPVSEHEVILEPGFKKSLLDWLDHFWNQQAAARTLGLTLRRGLLLLGTPGTGKTQLIRHILSRYPDRDGHLYVATASGRQADCFSRMLEAVGAPGRPKIVVMEDIDLLSESGGVPQAHLLNALDGLLRVENPVLWIATSNDPSGLALNLLDRPGRFDRVTVLPEPGPAEREALVRLFSREEIDSDTLRAVGEATDGFTGAHIREACASAILAQLAEGGSYGELLLAEIQRVGAQHSQAKNYFRGLAARQVGFAATKNGGSGTA